MGNEILNSIKQSEEANRLWNGPIYKAEIMEKVLLLIKDESRMRRWGDGGHILWLKAALQQKFKGETKTE